MDKAITITPLVIQPLTAKVLGQQQQFYIDVAINTQGISINGIQGTITFSDNTLSLVRIETGMSDIPLWITPPDLTQAGNISFSGIIPGGFSGLINPFDLQHILPATLMRLVFKTIAPGTVTVTVSPITVTKNDGMGTLQQVASASISTIATPSRSPSIYTTRDTVPPTITAFITRNKNLFNGKYTLIFTAVDKQSGIDHVSLKEGNSNWITIQSPYPLQDQTRHSIILLRAYDNAGNVSSSTIPALQQPLSGFVYVTIAFIVAITSYGIYKKRHKK